MGHRDFHLLDAASPGDLSLRDGAFPASSNDVAPGALPLEGRSASDASEKDGLDQLFRIHEYERCRMGQELHDSAGQLLVSLQLSVAHLRSVEVDSGHDGLIDEIQGIVRAIDREIRSLAFLHYPVELGDRSLCSAVQALALGFGTRTGIRTSFKCAGERTAVCESVSMAVLRVAQEALVNVHRHSRATSARVVLENRGDQIILTVSDDGVGMPAKAMPQMVRGIGLQSMRHRVESLGGQFKLRNLKHGTRVSASVPMPAWASQDKRQS